MSGFWDDAGKEGQHFKGGALDDRKGREDRGVGEQDFDLGFDLSPDLNLDLVLDPGLDVRLGGDVEVDVDVDVCVVAGPKVEKMQMGAPEGH